jgi:hypothetical protein
MTRSPREVRDSRLGFSAWVCALALLACGPTAVRKTGNNPDAGSGGSGSNVGPHVLDGIAITPANPLVQLDLNATGSQVFSVAGQYEDGTSDDQTANATFTVANSAVGTMNGATLAIPAFTAATAKTSLITATVGTFTAQAQITVVAYRSSGSDQDFFFILPYQDAAGSQTKPLDFSTAIPSLDVFFLMDTTGSMEGEITNLESALTGTVVPQIKAVLANTEFGVGAFDDFPDNGDADGEGADGTLDQPLKLRQAITATTSLVQTAVDGLSTGGEPIGNGGDLPEAGIEALYQVATGSGLTGPSPTSVPANHTGVGGVGFRAGTMPVIVSISDASSHTVGTDPNYPASCGDPYASTPSNIPAFAHTNAQTEAALGAICARVVGIAPVNGTCDAEAYYTAFATATGARVPPAAWDVGTRPTGCSETQCCIGQNGAGMATDANGLCPLVFRASTDGTGVSTSVVTGINMLTRFATFTVTDTTTGSNTDTSGNPLPAGHTTADFITAIVPTGYTLPPPPPALPDPTFNATEFQNVTPGTQVQFNVNAFNNFVMPTNEAQIFSATIQVLAGGCTPLDQRTVLILVPPTAISIE